MDLRNVGEMGGAGTFLGDSILRHSNENNLADVLLNPGPPVSKIVSTGNAAYAQATRDPRPNRLVLMQSSAKRTGNIPDACYATVYVDGLLLVDMSAADSTQAPPNVTEYSVNQLGAVEFYPGNAPVPSPFRSSECGLLLVWTQRSRKAYYRIWSRTRTLPAGAFCRAGASSAMCFSFVTISGGE